MLPSWRTVLSSVGLIAATAVTALPSDAPSSPAAPPTPSGDFACDGCNLLVISLTNLRADHVGAYGYSRNTTPRIDGLARKGLVFERAFSHASWTLPAAISLFTSRYPFTHGLMNRKSYEPLQPDVPTLIDVLKACGYATAAFVGDRDYSAAFGLTARFQFLDDCVTSKEEEDWHRYGVSARTVPRAIQWIRQHAGRRFFVFVQGYDAHCPFAVPESNPVFDPDYKGDVDFTKCYWTFGPTRAIRVRSSAGRDEEVYLVKTNPEDGDNFDVMLSQDDIRHMTALYDGEILAADRRVGTLLDEVEALGLADKTLVVFLSEHGDMLGKHGRFMRGGPLRGTFYDDVLHVPLIIRHPRLGPARIPGLVQLIDLAPTLLDMLGLPAPPGFAGSSLRSLVLQGRGVNDMVFAGSAFTPKKGSAFFRTSSIILAARSDEWKLIQERLFLPSGPADLFELYRVGSDPDELSDLSSQEPERLRAMRAALRGWLERIDAHNALEDLSR